MGNACTSIDRCRRSSSIDEALPVRKVVATTRATQTCPLIMIPQTSPSIAVPQTSPPIPLQPHRGAVLPPVVTTAALLPPVVTTAETLPMPVRGRRPNFPLPRELRDCIYGYLLDASEVRSHTHFQHLRAAAPDAPPSSDVFHRSCSTAHTYRFHTNILAVNKEIYAEASTALHSANTFVVVSYRWPNLGMLKHKYDVPIVTENARYIRNSKVVSLKYSVLHPTHLHGGSFLMLVRDFPQFLRMMQWLYFQTKVSMTLTMRRDEDGTFAEYPYAGELTSGPTVVLAPDQLQHQTQKSLETATFSITRAQLFVVLPGQTFTLRGPSTTGSQAPADRLARYISSCCGNRDVRVEAMLWGMVDTARSLKESADELLRQGQYASATARYVRLFDGCTSWDFSQFLPFVIDNTVSRSAARVLYQIILDSVTLASMLSFHQNKPDAGMRLASSTGLVINLLSKIPTDPTVWPSAIDSYLLQHPSQDALITGLILIKEPPFLRAALMAMAVFQLLRPDYVQSEADLAFVEEILGSEEALQRYQHGMTREEILGKLSVTAAPVKVFNSAVPEAVLQQRPKNFLKGWWIEEEEEEETNM